MKLPLSFGLLLILLLPLVSTQGLDPLYASLDTISNQQMLDLGVLSTEIPEEAFPLTLNYGSAPGFDEDNDGVGSQNEVVDVEVSAAQAKNPACVRWEIYSIDAASSSGVCHGAQGCCDVLKLMPSRYNWDAPLFLTFGAYGATKANIVSAQSVEMENGAVKYSKWQSVDVVFADKAKGEVFQLAQHRDILKAEHPDIQEIKIVDGQGDDVAAISEGETADVEIVLKQSSPSMGIQSAATGTTVVLEDVEASDMEHLNALDIAEENKPLENSIKNAGISSVQLVSIENAEALGASGGKVVFQKESAFTKVLHCQSEDASSCIILPACAYEQESCYGETASEIVVHVPHFSSIVLGIDNETVHLNISSPDNETVLGSGESLYLNITANISIVLNYSSDNGQVIALGNGTSFSTLLNGTLGNGVLVNGLHTLRFGILSSLGTNSTLDYSFTVSDSTVPSFSINMSNSSAHSATYLFLHLRITSSEFGNATYALNGQSSSVVLSENKTAVLLLAPQQGSNTLEINVSDAQGNKAHAVYAFTFTELGSCTDGLQNGAETGVDCGGSCTACITFNASVDRQAYNISDIAYITIISRAYSVVNVTVKRGNDVSWRHEFRPAFSGFPIAETRAIGNTSTASNYTVNATMYYMSLTEQKNASFEVVSPYQSPITVSISANSTTINENNDVMFSSSVAGNTSSISYKWDFQNDGTIDSTLPNLTWRFQNNGTFVVNLTVSDASGNQTDLETIVARKTFNLTVRVRDNSSGASIQNAWVEVGSFDANTSSDGSAVFTIPKGSYDVDVSHDSYRDSSGEVDLNVNQEYYANMSVADRLAPIITLLSPENGSTAYNNSIDFVYTVYDTSQTTCVLYTRTNSVLWKIASSVSLQAPSGQYSFTVNNLELAPYEWKVECRDVDGNYNSTSPFSLIINPELRPNELSVDLEKQDLDTAELEAIITQAMDDLKNLNGRDSEIADAIQLRKTLEKALTNVKRANRDLHSLEWRRLNDSELERETKTILDKVEELKKTTPKKFTVLEAREFVGYASKPDVEAVVQFLVDAVNAKLSKKEFSKLVDENNRLQSLLTITTKASRIELEFIEGGAKKHTVIQKKVASATEDFVPYVFYELIPKEVVKTTDDMEVFAEHEIIKKDPIVGFDLAKIRGYAYLIKDDVPLQRTESIASVLALQQVVVKKVGLITGFSVFGDVSKGLRETVDVRLIVEVIIIAILVVLYLVYSIGSIEEIKRRFEPKDVKEFREKADHAQREVENGAYENASSMYREVAMAYKALDQKKKAELNSMVTQLLNQVNVLYINKLLSEADTSLMKKDRKEMAAIYAKIRVLYKIISREYKVQVWQKCIELHRQLSAKQ